MGIKTVRNEIDLQEAILSALGRIQGRSLHGLLRADDVLCVCREAAERSWASLGASTDASRRRRSTSADAFRFGDYVYASIGRQAHRGSSVLGLNRLHESMNQTEFNGYLARAHSLVECSPRLADTTIRIPVSLLS